MTAHARIVIVGAGIGGLTTALALHAKGIDDVVVLESAGEIRPLGVGINIQPAAVAELVALRLGESLAATGIATHELRYLDRNGKILWTEPRGIAAGDRCPQYSIHRGVLQMLLLGAVRERLGRNSVLTGTRLQRFEQTRSGIRAYACDRATGNTVEFEGAALIGADGMHSAVRSQLHPGQCRLSSAKVQMWRGVTEVASFLDGRTMIVANDDSACRLVAYPISAHHAQQGRALVNWVCMVPSAPGTVSGDADWNCIGRLDEVLPHFLHWDFGWLDVGELLAGSSQILQYPMVDRDPLASWGTQRVTLLGDAAHLMYPVGANGASQAILDAVALAEELASGSHTVDALHRYEASRRAATTQIIQANRDRDRAERALAHRPGHEKTAALASITNTYRAIVERPPGMR